MMITKEEYEAARVQVAAGQDKINQYVKEQQEAFDARMAANPVFTAEELKFSAASRCPCGAGLAYPKGCGMFHYWDCAAILTGEADVNAKHTAQLPFTMYSVKSESEERGTTRP